MRIQLRIKSLLNFGEMPTTRSQSHILALEQALRIRMRENRTFQENLEQAQRKQGDLMDEIDHHRRDVGRFAHYLAGAEQTIREVRATHQELVVRCEEERRQTALMQSEYDRYRRDADRIFADHRNTIAVLTRQIAALQHRLNEQALPQQPIDLEEEEEEPEEDPDYESPAEEDQEEAPTGDPGNKSDEN
ncbi:uncharacterized protein [Henckelia pumila]|uniref:uncharacterized protein n=1 Tax=Henckelia pumila TaxID=405737 RepID=UPI003C6E83FE